MVPSSRRKGPFFCRPASAEPARSRLPIVRELAGAHGGTVTATSEPGRGSTFILSLPA
ncbi:ATP-binding protein [Actinoallomurus purpureus]|uniref:ATP-binding protein n=1 Tax=Actinoallomurus purpureus TaxID=478114 RepID=UPI0035584CA7